MRLTVRREFDKAVCDNCHKPRWSVVNVTLFDKERKICKPCLLALLDGLID